MNKQALKPGPSLDAFSPEATDDGEPQPERPKIGEPFIPYRRFHVLLIPEPMARSRELPAGAKLVYGRLTRYAGKNGLTWPAVETLAAEVGLGERQTQKHLSKLEAQGFLRREPYFDRSGGQTSNHYFFLWHPIFDEWQTEQEGREGVNSSSPAPAHPSSPRRVNRSSPKESHVKESHFQESQPGRAGAVHSGSPKESHGDSIDFGRLEFYTDSEENG